MTDTFILKDLKGTAQDSFKVGTHKLDSADKTLRVTDLKGYEYLSVSPANFSVTSFNFYWGTAPLAEGNVGDIVWNVNQNNPDNILCWRCAQPNVWEPQYTHPLQLPKTAAVNSIAQYKDGAWNAVSVEDLEISANQVTETSIRKFVTQAQLDVINDTSGVNTGDETRQSIINKLGPATSQQHGYLTNTDFNKLQVAYDTATELVNNPADLGIPTKLSELVDDINVATTSDLPTRVSQLVNDAGYVLLDRVPIRVSQLTNDANYLRPNDLPTKLSQFENDAAFITVEQLDDLRLNNLVDVDVSSNRLTDGYVLTYKAYLDKWIPFKPDVISTVNGVKADNENINLTTTNIPEGTNKYFTPERVTTWAESYIQTVPLRELQDVDIDDNQEGTILYFTDSAWRARRLEEITLLSIDNLSDVAMFDTITDFDVLTYNNGSWGNVAFTDNPRFTLGALKDTKIEDAKQGDILTFDENNRRWINKTISFSSNGQATATGDISLVDLSDVSFANLALQNGAVLTYNATSNSWGPSVISAAVNSVNGQSGIVTLTTANITEAGGNLYYTVERVDERITQRLANADLTAILGTATSGSILYYNGSSWSAGDPSVLNLTTDDLRDFNLDGLGNGDVLVNQNGYWVGKQLSDLLNLDTDDVPEGLVNLYYTDARVETYLSTAIDVILTAAIQDSAVTLSKIEDIANNKFLGNISGSPAAPVELTFGAGFTFDGTTVNVDAATIGDIFLDDLADVDLTTPPVSGDVLGYDSITGKWEPVTITSVTSVNGLDGVVTLTTSNIGEGTNLYYTNSRFDTRFGQTNIDALLDVNKTGWAEGKVWGFDATGNTVPLDLAAIGGIALLDLVDVNITTPADGSTIVWDAATSKYIESVPIAITDTDDVAEGTTNLYYTTARVDTRIGQTSINQLSDVDTAGWASGKVLGFNGSGIVVPLSVVLPSTTDDLPQGSTNKYYSDSLVNTWAGVTSVDVFQDVNKTGWTTGQVLGFNGSGVLVPVDVLTTATTTDSIPAGVNAARQYYSNAQVESYLDTIGLDKIGGIGGVGGAAPVGGQALIYNQATQQYEPGSASVISIVQNFNNVGDQNGLVYWCGSAARKQPFSNPATRSAPYTLTVTLSSNPSSGATSAAIDRNNSTLIQTASESNARFILDFGDDKLVKPNHYTIRGRSDTDTKHPRSWKLQGSMDGLTNWVDLDERTNNTSINQNTWFSGSCTATSSFRYLSILMTGFDSSGTTTNLTFSEFEVYGDITVAGAEPIESTDDLPEGSSNLYYTDARVQSYLTSSATLNGSALVDNSVTLAKLPQVTQNQILGRYDIGTGNLQTITLGTGLSFTGSTLNVSIAGGVTSVVGQTGHVTDIQIAAALNTLTGTDRLSYNSLKDTVTSLSAVPFGGFIEVGANKTYPLFTPDRSYKILSLRVKSASGTCTWAVQIAGVNVTGLSAVSVSSTDQLVNATGSNTVTTGQRVTVVSTSNSSAVDIEFTLMLEAL